VASKSALLVVEEVVVTGVGQLQSVVFGGVVAVDRVEDEEVVDEPPKVLEEEEPVVVVAAGIVPSGTVLGTACILLVV
jgi:hypothetical protein